MKEIALKGTARTETGKKATKALRKQNIIPCNLYGEATDGNGKPVAEAFSLPFTEIRKAVYTPDVLVCTIDIDGKEHKAVIKELQFHPVTDAILHADFLEVNDTKPITIGIPVNLVGHAQGVRDGGRMSLSIRKIAVKAPYKNIPEKLDVDVTNLKIGKAIKVGELSYEGIEIATSKEVIVCSVKMTRAAAAAAAESAE
jgi:large subunit ribosomal protein L25